MVDLIKQFCKDLLIRYHNYLKSHFFSRNNVNNQVVVIMKRRATFKQWMPIAFLTTLICCLSLAHAVVITDGYYKTCEQYKRNLIQLLGSRGREVQVRINDLSPFFHSSHNSCFVFSLMFKINIR
jgi:hypothetical protein